jgi:fructuronate reductase
VEKSGARAPARVVHLGLGAFSRAHQAWYTDAVGDGRWGIAGFTGRKPDIASALSAQGGLYALIERGPSRDSVQVIDALSEAHDGADLVTFSRLCAATTTALVTLTISEAGYRASSSGGADRDDRQLASDITELTRLCQLDDSRFSAELQTATVTTAPARLVLGLEARRRAGGGALAVVSCDNLPANGRVLAAVLEDVAADVDAGLLNWMRTSVSFVETSVDRITPATTPSDLATAETAIGLRDAVPVVTEPFRDWALSGDFPAGRPTWEAAGARFVADIEPFERRKLWLLNGAHSLLSNAGILRGHQTVAEAIGDDTLCGWVSDFWDEAGGQLDDELLDLDAYRDQLTRRFANARIEHRLRQIATNGSTKFALRIVPVAKTERSEGRSGAASARALASWVAAVRAGISVDDPRSAELHEAVGQEPREATRRLLAVLDAELAADDGFVADVRDATEELLASTPVPSTKLK